MEILGCRRSNQSILKSTWNKAETRALLASCERIDDSEMQEKLKRKRQEQAKSRYHHNHPDEQSEVNSLMKHNNYKYSLEARTEQRLTSP